MHALLMNENELKILDKSIQLVRSILDAFDSTKRNERFWKDIDEKQYKQSYFL